MHVHRSPAQHPLRLVVHLGHVLEVDSPAKAAAVAVVAVAVVVESGGLDWARSEGGLIPL